MAKGRVVKSAIDAALNTARKNADVAKEVMESTGKSATRATMIKNAVNSVQSNMSSGQAKAIANAGEDAAKVARREGIEAATSQVKARTAQVALDKHTYQGNPAVQKSKEFVNNKRTNQVIDGHNAKQRDVEMQTMVNNVRDRNIDRVPKDHETAKNVIDKANKAVRDGIENTTKIENTVPINTFKAGKTATYNVDNITKLDGTAPVINYNNNIKTMEISDAPKTSKQDPKIDELLDTINKQEKMIKDFQDGIENGTKNLNAGRNDINKSGEDIKSKLSGKAGQYVNDYFGGITDTYNSVANGGGFLDSFKKAHQKDDGSINMKRAAGTFIAASAAARVASGGGLYKDRYGNPNLIGVPFI